MRLGYNLVWLTDGAGGVGRYAVELLAALVALDEPERIVVFASRGTPTFVRHAAWAQEVEWVDLPLGPVSRAAMAAQLTAVPALAARRRLDVVHNPAAGPPALAPGVATVVTMHDLIWLHLGDEWAGRGGQRTTRLVQVHCARRSGRVVAVSQATADDLVSTLGLDPARVDVVPQGVNEDGPADVVPPETLRAELDLGDGPVVLCVAQKRPYKNIASLVRAVAELRDEDVRLVVPGAPTQHEDELRALARSLDVADRVRFPPWVSEAQLEGLYGLAACVVLPSLMEGAGLPVLEAMRRGVPVACSDRWALPEVAGDAALLFDPSDQAAVTAAVRRLVREPELARELAARGRARAACFTWRRTAEGTLAAYRRALG